MKHLLILAVALAFGGCYKKSVRGTLSVYETFQLKKGKKMITIQPDEYQSKLNLKDRKKFQLVINGVQGKKFTFKFPKQLMIPRTQGRLSIKSSDLNQPVDVELNFSTDTSRSEIRTSFETCSRTYHDRVCRWESTPGRRVCRENHMGHRTCRYEPPRRRRVCQSMPRTVFGEREITFRNISSVTYFTAELLSPGGEKFLAAFNGEQHRNRRETLSRGACRLDYDAPRRPW